MCDFCVNGIDQIPDDRMTNNVVDDLRKITFQSSFHWSVHPIFRLHFVSSAEEKHSILLKLRNEMPKKLCRLPFRRRHRWVLFALFWSIYQWCLRWFHIWTELNHLSIFGALQASILNCESWNASLFRSHFPRLRVCNGAIYSLYFGSRKLLKTFLINYSWSFRIRRVFTIWNKAEIGCVSIGLFSPSSPSLIQVPKDRGALLCCN